MRYQRILVWEVNWVGDVLFSTPFLRALKEKFPDAYITCITSPWTKEVLETNPNVNEIIVYDGKTINKGLLNKLRLIRKLRRKNYDAAFLLHRSLTRAVICLLSGIKQRIGHYYKKRNFLLTHKAKAQEIVQHRVEGYLDLARKIGADSDIRTLEFYIKEEDAAQVENLLRANNISKTDRVVILNPGGNWEPKRWPVEKYAELSRMVIKNLKAKVIITGSESDLNIYLKMQDLIDEKLISFCGKTNLRQLAALFKRADVVISGDSGPLHLALAAGAKVIALFGPTSTEITGPYGGGKYIILQKDVNCLIPCYNVSCGKKDCMNAIKPEEVFEEVRRVLSGEAL